MHYRRPCLAAMAVLALIGCDPTPSDSPPSDSPPSTGTVTVKVLGPDLTGIDVYFQDASSTLLGHGVTDSTGMVTGPMRDGGFVTVVDPVGQSRSGLYTYTDVQVGDELVVGVLVPEIHHLESSFTFQRSPDLEDVDIQAVHCAIALGSSTKTATTVQESLHGTTCGPVADLLLVALAQDGTPKGWTILDDVNLEASLDLSGATFSPLTAQDVTLTNVPADVHLSSSSSHVVTPRGTYLSSTLGIAPSTQTLHFDLAAVPDASNKYSLFFTTGSEYVGFFDEHASLESRSIDVGSHMLPSASDVQLSVDQHEVTWTEAPAEGGLVPDYAIASIQFVLPIDVTGLRIESWHLIAPRTPVGDDVPPLRALKLPILPGVLELDPSAGDQAVVVLERGAVAGGYEALQQAGVLPYRPGGGRFGEGVERGVYIDPPLMGTYTWITH